MSENIILIFLLFFVSMKAFNQDVVEYVENQQYNSAFKMLEKMDPHNKDPELVIQKVNLAINYFVTSIMHQVFAFKDLRPGEDLLEIRGTQGTYESYQLKADTILLNLIKTYPENQELRRALGSYYFDVHYRYGDQWLIPEDSLIGLYEYHFRIALENGSFDYETIYIIGYANLLKGEYPKAVNYFIRSLDLKEDEPKCHYNLAYAHMALDEWQEALFHSHRAMVLYEDNKWKADAARMIAIAYDELGNLPKSLDFYRQSNLLDPNNYYTIKPMLMVTSKIGNEIDLGMHSKELVDLDPDNPAVYQDLIEVYYGINEQKKLLEFLDSQLIAYKEDTLVMGNIHFYKGVIYYDLKDLENSRVSFETARYFFSEVYKTGHPVFPAIDSYLNSY